MSPLPWPLTGNRFFFFQNFFFLFFLMFLIIFKLFYKLYIAIINHKQVLCLARKNDSLMILQYSYILIIIFIIKGKKDARKKTSDGHWQHIMASLVIIYKLAFDFFSFWCASHWFVLILGEGGRGASARPPVALNPHTRPKQTALR